MGFLLLFRFKIGLAFYLAYIVLVPYMNFNILGINFQWNLINTLVLLLSFIYTFRYKNKHPIDYAPFVPFLVYLMVSLVMMLFQTDTPFIYEINAWRNNLFLLFFPFVLWNQMQVDYTSYQLYKRVLLACIFIITLYGLFLATIPGQNPYISTLAIVNGSEFKNDYALAEGGGRMFGRISSVFSHPMVYGFFLGIAMIYVYYIYQNHIGNRKLKFFLFLLITIIGINFVTCGIRSVLIGFFVTFVFYLLQVRQFKVILFSTIFFL